MEYVVFLQIFTNSAKYILMLIPTIAIL